MKYKLILTTAPLIFLFLSYSAFQQTLDKTTEWTPAKLSQFLNNDSTSSMPDDSLTDSLNDCIPQSEFKITFNMPVFIPDSTLTASMPNFTAPKDERMMVPLFESTDKQCR